MPYSNWRGEFERARRTGHTETVVRALAEKASFYVPAEQVADLTWLRPKAYPKALLSGAQLVRLEHAIAVDGSRQSVEARPGLPSVRYGYVQAAAVYLDLEAIASQRAERFVDPVVLRQASRRALVSLDFPIAGAYRRPGIDIRQSWRELVDALFRSKRVDVNGLNQTLLDLLYLLHGTPSTPATVIPINCTACGARAIPVPSDGRSCPSSGCGERLFPTDVLGLHEEVVEEGSNESPLTRLMQAVELLILLGLMTLLWRLARDEYLTRTLFVLDGPLALYGPGAPIMRRALAFVQHMAQAVPGGGPYLCGVEKTGTFVDYARAIARYDGLRPGELLRVDAEVIGRVTNSPNPQQYGKDDYWGRKFFYRSLDGRVLVLTVPPAVGMAYDRTGGQPDPSSYPTLPSILDVIDRTGSAMYQDAIIPIALAHGAAAYPIGVGTDVLKLVARRKLGLDRTPL